VAPNGLPTRVSPVIRRLALTACALGAAVALSSCATFSDNDAVARVGDVELGRDAVAELGGIVPPSDSTVDTAAGADPDRADATEVRQTLAQWIQVALVESAVGEKTEAEIASLDNLVERMETGLAALGIIDPEVARASYEQGVPNSPTVCLAAIPVEAEADLAEVLAAIEGGATFAEASSQFGTDPGIADTGGVILSSSGTECFVASELNPAVLEALNGVTAGTAVPIVLDGLIAVAQLRPFDELSEEGQQFIVDQSLPPDTAIAELQRLVGDGDVYVDPYYGWWDAETVSVRPLGG